MHFIFISILHHKIETNKHQYIEYRTLRKSVKSKSTQNQKCPSELLLLLLLSLPPNT